MSLLDDIEREAQRQRQQLDAADTAQARAYREHTLPRLRRAYAYFNELIGRLSELNLPVSCHYEIPGAGSISDFAHANYRIATDNSDQLTDLRVTFTCQRDKAIEFVVRHTAEVTTIRDALHAAGLSFDQRPGYVRGGRDQGTLFTVAGQVPVQIRLCAVQDSLDLRLEVSNLPGLGNKQKRLRPDQLDEAFLDELGRFMLRRDNQLEFNDSEASRELDNTDTEALRRQLKAKSRDASLAQENKAPPPGFFRRLFRRGH